MPFRVKSAYRTIARTFGLKHYIGEPCPLHPLASHCVRHTVSGHCVLGLQERAAEWYQDNIEYRKQRKRELAAKRRAWRERSRRGWLAGRKTMDTWQWKLMHRAKKLFGREF